MDDIAESPKPEVEIDEKNEITKTEENVNKSKNDRLTETEDEEDEFLVNYRKFPKLLEEVKEKQNVYNACLIEIIRQISVTCKERAVLTERIRTEQDKLFNKLGDMVLIIL